MRKQASDFGANFGLFHNLLFDALEITDIRNGKGPLLSPLTFTVALLCINSSNVQTSSTDQ